MSLGTGVGFGEVKRGEAGEPGAQSHLVGKTVFAEICQRETDAEDKNGKKLLNEDGTPQRETKDEVEGWVAATSDEE